MTRAVVIGATGQIGRVAVDVPARNGWEVTALSRGGGRDGDWPEGVRTARVDRADDSALAAAVGDGCDVLGGRGGVRAGARAAADRAGRPGRIGRGGLQRVGVRGRQGP